MAKKLNFLGDGLMKSIFLKLWLELLDPVIVLKLEQFDCGSHGSLAFLCKVGFGIKRTVLMSGS